MCGIAGLMTRDGGSPSRATLDTMLSVLGHRGPNGEGMHISQGVGLAQIAWRSSTSRPATSQCMNRRRCLGRECRDIQLHRTSPRAHGCSLQEPIGLRTPIAPLSKNTVSTLPKSSEACMRWQFTMLRRIGSSCPETHLELSPFTIANPPSSLPLLPSRGPYWRPVSRHAASTPHNGTNCCSCSTHAVDRPSTVLFNESHAGRDLRARRPYRRPTAP